MPRTTFRRVTAAALLTLALATSAAAVPLGAGRERTPSRQPASFWTVFLHLIGTSGGTFDPNGWKLR
jgi:hypothetical protein